MSDFHVIIPARFQSTRLPGKPLALIGDKPMIVHVCDRAKKSGAKTITVATDSLQIVDEVNRFGFNAVLTKSDHQSGSDRVYEAAQIIGLNQNDIVVNVQGDEPFIPSKNITLVASLIQADGTGMSTLCSKIAETKDVLDPNCVKVIFDKNNKAIYFSRSVIPFCRDQKIEVDKELPFDYFRHIGIYAYKKQFLKQFISWSPSKLELCESLEQLRVIDNGGEILVACLDDVPPHGVDTQADLDKARIHYSTLEK